MNPVRTVGAAHHTVIKLTCKYVGTQGSHQPTFFINSTQVPNDWTKAGKTAVSVPPGSTAISQASNELNGHQHVVTPTWASGIDSNNAAYNDLSVARGTISFNCDFTKMFDSGVRLYDGSVTSGKHITDTDEEIGFVNNKAFIRQDGWVELEFDNVSGTIAVKPWNGSTYVAVAYMQPNAGGGFSEMYPLVISEGYVRVALDTREEIELFCNKIPSFFPGTVGQWWTTSGAIFNGNWSGGPSDPNFKQIFSSPICWIGSNRFFTIDNIDGRARIKATSTSVTDAQFWVAWEANSSLADEKFLQVLRRLE
jgi:hypothetical protein